MFGSKIPTPYGLWLVSRRLQRAKPEPDLEPVHPDVSKLVTRLAAGHTEAEIDEQIDRYVQAHVAKRRRALVQRHCAELRALDLLDATVSSYLAHFEERCTDERGKLAEIEGVVAHIWDRVSDPDTPLTDPIR